jgi:hypothetical protein
MAYRNHCFQRGLGKRCFLQEGLQLWVEKDYFRSKAISSSRFPRCIVTFIDDGSSLKGF